VVSFVFNKQVLLQMWNWYDDGSKLAYKFRMKQMCIQPTKYKHVTIPRHSVTSVNCVVRNLCSRIWHM